MSEETPRRYIFVGKSTEKRWLGIIEEALSAGSLMEVADDKTAVQSIMEHHYEAVFIDGDSVEDISLLISRIRAQRPEARVVVIAQQDWKLAREVFLSGATDYIGKSLSKRERVSSLRLALTKRVRVATAAAGGY